MLSETETPVSLGKRTHDDSVVLPARKLPRRDDSPTGHHVIAFDPSILGEINKLSYGVQYTLAHLISTGQLDYTSLNTITLQKMQGPNTQANDEVLAKSIKGDTGTSPSVMEQMFAQELAANSPWVELDKEEEALAKDAYAGLGNHPDYPGWYGGRVAFRGRITKSDGDGYKILLDRGALGSSCRFTRRFGSKHFIRIKIPSSIFYSQNNRLIAFFKQRFVLWGHVFQACYAKDDNVFLLKVNDVMLADGSVEKTGGLSLDEFVEWFNPLESNRKQPLSKWAARFSLGFSNSVPGPRISPEDILREDDIISESQSDMTDGSGFCNFHLLSAIRERYGLDKIPTAIQFRLGGCKGMLILREDGSNALSKDGFKVWVRPSQTKIKGQLADPGHVTLDLLRSSYVRTPSQISAEVIINIAENSFGEDGQNTSHRILPELMEKSLMEMVESLTTWEGPDAMFKLWSSVEKVGGVSAMRRARGMVGQQRFKGLGYQDYEDEDNGDEIKCDLDEGGFETVKSMAWWPDQISGCPSSLEETILYLLDAGFTPQRCPVLREKLQKVVTAKILNKIERMKIAINQSASAFVIPDPYGVLEPDEVQFKHSHYDFKMPDGTNTNIVLGDILLSRNPCKLPTDVRKVKAVEHPKLYKYTDVIVCSIKGNRRFIDYLAGGDYDGDTALAIWEPKLVEPFRNADDHISVEPDAVKPDMASSCFQATKETAGDFSDAVQHLDAEQKIGKLQQYLLGAVNGTSLTGKYSVMHDNAVYQYGYESDEAILLAYKFCKVLDGPKSGLHLKAGVLEQDHRKFGASLGPSWKDPKRTKSSNRSNLGYLQRPCIKGRFIMDIMNDMCKDLSDHLVRQMKQVTFAPLSKDEIHDDDLERPWRNTYEAVQELLDETQSPATSSSSTTTCFTTHDQAIAIRHIIAHAKQRDLKRIQEHVKASYQVHDESVKETSRSKGKRAASGFNFEFSQRKGKRDIGGDSCLGGGGADFTSLPITKRQDVLRKASKFFNEHPTPGQMEVIKDAAEIARLRASYAYVYDLEKNKHKVTNWSRFPFDVAARELCAIKANSMGPSKTVTSPFYEKFKMVKWP